jgi:hypothetical protein
MENEEQETEVVGHDSLAPCLEAETRKWANSKKRPKSEAVSRDGLDGDSETEASTFSDEELRLAISHPSAIAWASEDHEGGKLLKRTHPELPALRNAGDWERAYEVTEDECLKGQFLIDNLGASRYIEPKIAMTLLVLRQKMIYDMQIESAQGCTLMDNALTAQYNTFKLQRMLGDFARRRHARLNLAVIGTDWNSIRWGIFSLTSNRDNFFRISALLVVTPSTSCRFNLMCWPRKGSDSPLAFA